MSTRKNKQQRRKARKKKEKMASRPGRACGLCGKTTNLTKTECCGQWICDDEDQYVLFSYATNSCHRNHRRYTLCGFHHMEGHPGRWQDCAKCREAFETEMYVWYGTNEYNFEKLRNPPKYEPTRCRTCGRVIVLGEEAYSYGKDGYSCEECTAERMGDALPSSQPADAAPPEVITGLFAGSDDLPERNGEGQSLPAELSDLQAEVPPRYRARFAEICEQTDAFCDAQLNDEYKALCREMATSVCQEGSPVLRGETRSWAAGIVYALGQVNFLTDPSQQPHLTSKQLADGLGVSVSNMQAKGKVIREGLDLVPFDPDWTLPAVAGENPLTWMFEVNGFLVDIRHASRDAQAAAYEQGLIPYIPADRNA